MRLPTGIDREPDLQRLVIISAFLHLFIILFAFIPLQTGEREFRSYHVKLVSPLELNKGGRAGLKRSRRIIPKKRLPPVRAEERKAIPKKTAKGISSPEPEMALKKAEETIAREIERLRAIKEISRHKRGNEGKREEIEIIRKRVLSTSSGEEGMSGEATGVDANSYYGMIIEMIHNQWTWPEIGPSDLEVTVSIRIDGKGNIISQEIEKSSGNTFFDQRAMRAISKANPLPPPPMGMEQEIGVRFHL